MWLRTKSGFGAQGRGQVWVGWRTEVRLAGVGQRAVGTLRTMKGEGGFWWRMRQGIATLRAWDANWN